MRNTLKRISCILAMVCGLSSFAACGNEQGSVNKGAPNYQNNDDQFTTFAYSGIYHNWWATGLGQNRDKTYFNESFYTAENLKKYKDAGLNTLFINYVFNYNGITNTVSSDGDKVAWSMTEILDMAWAQGLKCLIFESNLHSLSGAFNDAAKYTWTEEKDKFSLIGSEYKYGTNSFATQEDLDEFVYDCLDEVKDHPAFYGVSLIDEPRYTTFHAMGEVYQAIKKAAPNAYVHMNLNPLSPGIETTKYCNDGALSTKAAYEKYLEDFYNIVQPQENICYDDYPIHGNNAQTHTIKVDHLRNAQIVAEFCKEKGLRFDKVFQTCSFKTGDWVCRTPSERDMYWQLNIGMAMGIKQFSYWTYFPVVNEGNEYYEPTASFVDREGNPNPVYYSMQKIHSEMQGMAKALMHFEYQGLRKYSKAVVPGDSGFYGGVTNNTLQYVKNVEQNSGGLLLVTELYDKEKNQFGYYVVNTTDTSSLVDLTDIKVTVEFDGGFKKVQTYRNGEPKNSFLKDGKTEFYLTSGEGVFLLPY